MNTFIRTLLLGLMLLSLPLAAEVYTYLDAEGNRVFTDKPRTNNAQRVQLAPTNALSSEGVQPTRVLSPPAAAPVRYQLLRILVPEPDATVRDQTGSLIVTLNSEPGLMEGHSYRLLLDGQPVAGQAGRSPVFPLSNLDRGTHQLAAEILDGSGRILERTPSQPFHMKRLTLADKRRVRPCQLDDYGVRLECPLKDKPPPKKHALLPFL
jgi:hypothetical protein